MQSLDFILKPIESIDVGECKGCVQHVSRHVVVLLHDVVLGVDRHDEVLQLGQVGEITEHEHVAGASVPVCVIFDGFESVLQAISSLLDPHSRLFGNYGHDRGISIAGCPGRSCGPR